MTHNARRRPRTASGLRAVVAALVVLAALPFGAAMSGAQSGGDIDVTRLWGQDRFATSVAVAQQFVQESGGSIDAAVLVSGRSWHDAVIAAGLAGTLGAPVLLTETNEVPAATAGFLSAAGVRRVVIVGSTSTVSDQVVEEVEASLADPGEVERISGNSPSAASVAVARRMGAPGAMPGHGQTVVIASSQVFADAMVAGGFSARGGHPVLLTPPDSLDAEVAAYVTESGALHVVVMGGTAAVSSSVGDELEALGVEVTRLGGSTRLHTALAVADFLEGKYSDSAGDRCFDRANAGLATAWVPFDAFSAGPLLGKLCAPLLLTDPKKLDPDVGGWIAQDTGELLVFGGTAAVSPAVLSGLDDAALLNVLGNAADERAEIVARLTDRINAGSYGVNKNNVLRGPASFRVDLDNCPRDWSDTAGITGTEIRIGHTAVLSGPLAGYSAIVDAMENYFDWVNENDPVAGKQIKLLVKDDGNIAAQTIEYVDELLENENVFSILTTGTRHSLVNALKINSECVPHPFVLSGLPAFGDPNSYPWSTGMQLSFASEALLWGEWIKQNLAGELPVKVVSMTNDVEIGLAYEYAFEAWAERNPGVVSEFVPLRHDPAATTLIPETETAVTLAPDVYIAMTFDRHCRQSIQAAGRLGLVDDVKARGGALITSSMCSNITQYLEPAGDAADDWWIAGGGTKDITDPANFNEPFVKLLNENLRAAGLSTRNVLHGTGFLYAYTYVEALRVAAELPGGLTRSNFILAVRSLDITHPLYLDGIRFRMNGNADAYLVEGTEFLQYDARSRSWQNVGPVIDRNGRTPTCDWDQSEARCR